MRVALRRRWSRSGAAAARLSRPFAAVAASQPKFAAHRTAQQQQTIKAPDGTPHLVHACTLAEARNPTTAGGKPSPRTSQTLVTEPLRWLSGKSSALDDWSLVNSNKLLDNTYDLMVAVEKYCFW